jgi:hypothetical protein
MQIKRDRFRKVPIAARDDIVCYGSKADVCVAKPHVRFTPDSDRKSRHAANGDVRFTPESGH